MLDRIDPPRVAVLMATFNGAEFIAEQIQSILSSSGVDPHIFLSDDGSHDETIAAAKLAADGRLTILKPKKSGSAAQNFIRLIRDTDWTGFDFVSLTDQDDIWEPRKLQRAIQMIISNKLDGYSCDVTAFWEDGREKYIRKSQTIRALDHAFEAAGPGSTYVFPIGSANFLRDQLNAAHPDDLLSVNYHDWLFYSIFRSQGKAWKIDQFSGLRYRQHGENVLGASDGISTKLSRLKTAFSGDFFDQAAIIARIAGTKGPVIEALQTKRKGLIPAILSQMSELRRVRTEALAVCALLTARILAPSRK